VAGGKASTGNHAVPTQPRCEHQPDGANLQDLWRAAIETVRSNPYMLAKDIYGIGFATADQIARKVGIPRDSLNRARAGIDHVLLEATSDGHCALPLGKLKLAAVKLLEVPEGTVEQPLSQMLTSGSLLLEEIDSCRT
jgi:exodeoxyribonuclease V alpha subunit